MTETQNDQDQGGVDRVSLAFEIAGRVWAIRLESLAVLADAMRSGVTAEISAEDIEAAAIAARRGAMSTTGGVAVLSLKGVITPKPSLLAMIFGFGGGGLMSFRDSLRQAAADPEIGAIVMDVDSPGGIVDMVPEVAADIRAAREQKPIVAVSNVQAASAAYWLAAQAHEIVVTPSGDVGSVGVYQLHTDRSKMLETMGVTPTLISAGKYKVEGNPYEPLGEEARQASQSMVDDYYAMFVKDVAAGRGVKVSDVRSGYGEGRTVLASRAVAAGLADKVDTLESTIARLSSARGRAAVTSRRAEDVTGTDPDHSSETTAPAALSTEDRLALLDALV